MKPSITINILRYNIFPGKPAHSMYSIYNMETKRRLNEDMELHFLEVPKFQKKPVSEMTSVERWLAYFSNKLDLLFRLLWTQQPSLCRIKKSVLTT